MDKIDRNKDLEIRRSKLQPNAKKTMDMLRKSGILSGDLMMEGELTIAQRECLEPVGDKGYYRMYRWECQVCSEVGRKLPYTEMQTEAIQHYEKTRHNMIERGGVFDKKELYTY